MEIRIVSSAGSELSPYIFGHNLEHTRSAIGGGLSAQMLNNRKFAGKPAKNSGVAQGWKGFGDRVFFELLEHLSYTRHDGCEGMMRKNELQSQRVQNISGGECGIKQAGLTVISGKSYDFRIVTMTSKDMMLRIDLTDREGSAEYAGRYVKLTAGDWEEHSFEFISNGSDNDAVLRIGFEGIAMVTFGAVSMMPSDNFRGMRMDVINCLKEIGPSVLRWPGGNFAGEYRWKDGLMPVDMRGPLQAYTEIETQPHSLGYDFHEINTDDFIALCRKIGAEPFLTINLVWNTPLDTREWVEYVNGGVDTEYGRKRAENGHPEPYNVKFWSLGNEMGYGHMEGPMQPDDYVSLAEKHIPEMLDVSPDLELFSSGPYPDDNWSRDSAAKLSDHVRYISLHHYAQADKDYTTPEGIKETYLRMVGEAGVMLDLAKDMRKCLDEYSSGLHISFDEWNFWYAWYRTSNTAEGVFAAKVMHLLIGASNELNMPFICYFQPVGEGAILVDDASARLTADGQVFSLMKVHKGGALLKLDGVENDAVMATLKDGILSVTFINEDYDDSLDFSLCLTGSVLETRLLSSEELLPDTYFEESGIEYCTDEDRIKFSLPPHSVGMMKIRV